MVVHPRDAAASNATVILHHPMVHAPRQWARFLEGNPAVGQSNCSQSNTIDNHASTHEKRPVHRQDESMFLTVDRHWMGPKQNVTSTLLHDGQLTVRELRFLYDADANWQAHRNDPRVPTKACVEMINRKAFGHRIQDGRVPCTRPFPYSINPSVPFGLRSNPSSVRPGCPSGGIGVHAGTARHSPSTRATPHEDSESVGNAWILFNSNSDRHASELWSARRIDAVCCWQLGNDVQARRTTLPPSVLSWIGASGVPHGISSSPETPSSWFQTLAFVALLVILPFPLLWLFGYWSLVPRAESRYASSYIPFLESWFSSQCRGN